MRNKSNLHILTQLPLTTVSLQGRIDVTFSFCDHLITRRRRIVMLKTGYMDLHGISQLCLLERNLARNSFMLRRNGRILGEKLQVGRARNGQTIWEAKWDTIPSCILSQYLSGLPTSFSPSQETATHPVDQDLVDLEPEAACLFRCRPSCRARKACHIYLNPEE